MILRKSKQITFDTILYCKDKKTWKRGIRKRDKKILREKCIYCLPMCLYNLVKSLCFSHILAHVRNEMKVILHKNLQKNFVYICTCVLGGSYVTLDTAQKSVCFH